MKWLLIVIASVGLLACQSGSGSVADKVLADFGLRDHPEGYVAGSDRVFEQMDTVGATELKRLNASERHGEIQFEEDGRRGQYYKEVKVYESFRPVDVQSSSGGGARDRSYSGLIEYRYRVYQGARKPSRAEAAAESASIPTGSEGSELYRYTFSVGGVWDGGRGERTRR